MRRSGDVCRGGGPGAVWAPLGFHRAPAAAAPRAFRHDAQNPRCGGGREAQNEGFPLTSGLGQQLRRAGAQPGPLQAREMAAQTPGRGGDAPGPRQRWGAHWGEQPPLTVTQPLAHLSQMDSGCMRESGGGAGQRAGAGFRGLGPAAYLVCPAACRGSSARL